VSGEEGVQEMQQHLRVAAHRPRDVAQHDERRRQEDAGPPAQRREVAEGLAAVAHGTSEVDALAPRIGREPPRADGPQGHHHAGDKPFGADELLGAHLVEVARAQELVGGERQGGGEFDAIGE